MTKNPKFKWDFLYPLLWGNGTFHPILNYSVKGILFYQGCSNVGDPAGQYTQRLADLVAQWRREFKQGELPFYFVQIAPYHNGDVNGDWGPRLREQQFNAAKVIPNSGIVCTEDLVYPYEVEQIHPCQKQPVGERLALQALSKTYGVKGLFSESMTFKEMKIVGDTVKVHFDNTYGAYNRLKASRASRLQAKTRFPPCHSQAFLAGRWQRRMERVHRRNQPKGKEACGFALLLPQFPAWQHGQCRWTSALSFPYRQLVINNITVDLGLIQRPTVL